MKYDVHLYAVVRIKVKDIEAESHLEAIEKAEPIAGLFAAQELSGEALGEVDHFEFADELVYALVDEEGDEEFERSAMYDGRDKPWEPMNNG